LATRLHKQRLEEIEVERQRSELLERRVILATFVFVHEKLSDLSETRICDVAIVVLFD
jgi:hypothetical protein